VKKQKKDLLPIPLSATTRKKVEKKIIPLTPSPLTPHTGGKEGRGKRGKQRSGVKEIYKSDISPIHTFLGVCKKGVGQISRRKLFSHEIYNNSGNLSFYNDTRLQFKVSFIKKEDTTTKRVYAKQNLPLHFTPQSGVVKDFAENLCNNSFLFNKFTNLLMKNGEKSKSQKIVYNTLNILKDKIKNTSAFGNTLNPYFPPQRKKSFFNSAR